MISQGYPQQYVGGTSFLHFGRERQSGAKLFAFRQQYTDTIYTNYSPSHPLGPESRSALHMPKDRAIYDS